MNTKELKEMLEEVPYGAKVYVTAVHGQSPEQAGEVLYTLDETALKYYGDDLDWLFFDEVGDFSKVTGVQISY